MELVDKVRTFIEKPINDAGYTIEDILYVYEDRNYFLRVVIGKNGVIEIEDCVVVSKLINPILDDADLIENNYILDVCSKEEEKE